MKPKLKHKFRAVFTTALSLFILTLTALHASAMSGSNEGGSGNTSWSVNSTPFGVLTVNDNFAWRADLYVSTNEDGKIKDSDSIGHELALVGSLLCTSTTFANYTTYIQTNYTNETRDDFNKDGGRLVKDSEGNLTGVQYTLPTLVEFDKDAPFYYDASSQTVAIADSKAIDLFQDQWKAPTDFVKVQNKLTKDGYEKHIKDMLLQLLDKNGQGFLDELKKSLNPQLGKTLVSKCEGAVTIPDIYQYLLPVNPTTGEINTECMVEWALVLTPLYRFEAVVPFYYRNNGTFSSVSNTYIALDAFWIAEYDVASRLLNSRGWYSQTYNGSPVFKEPGMLSWWLGCIKSVNNSGAPGIAAYCTKEGEQYLGVFTQHETLSQYLWSRLLVDEPSEYAKRGGIAVFTTEITTPEAPVYYHTYTYKIDENNPPDGYTVGTAYSQEQLLKFIDKLPAPTITVSQGSAPTGEYYCPTKDTEATSRGVPVAAMTPNPTIAQPGATKSDYPTYTNKELYLEKFPGTIPEPSIITTPLVDSTALKTPKATPDVTSDDPKEYHVKIIHVEVKQKTPPPAPADGTNRIKSQDVTQMIEIKSTADEYLNAFSSYANKDPNNFNTNQAPFNSYNSTHKATDGVWITSIYNPADPNSGVHAQNYLNYTESAPGHKWGDYYYYYETGHKESCKPDCNTHHHTKTTVSCNATISNCHWTKEYIDPYFGVALNGPKQRTWDNKGSIVGTPGWNTPTTSNSTVGVVIPESYYAYKDVVKSAATYDYKNAPGYNGLVYTLPERKTSTCHDITSNNHAVFDILMQDKDSYWIQYRNGNDIVGMNVHQSSTFTTKDKDADKQSSTGDGKFEWLKDMDSVRFIAHRDLLSADNVSTSLAVSGYMAKYANNSNTFEYLKFMEKAGFTFKGLDNLKGITDKSDAYTLKINTNEAETIGHDNRVVWISNAATVNHLKGTKTGSGASEYNTNFVGGKNNIGNITQRQKCHFGLGGLKTDGADIFSRIKDTPDNLKTAGLNYTSSKGDAERTIYYTAIHSRGDEVEGDHGKSMGTGHHEPPHTGCHGSTPAHTCSYTTDTHSASHPKNVNNVSGNNYITKSGSDIFISSMDPGKTHNSPEISDGSQTGAIEKIEASRLSFEVSVGVEGTTAGQYNGVPGEAGLTYKPTNSEGKIVDNYKLALSTFGSHANVLTLVANSETEETKSWKENTFEVRQANYQHVGDAKGFDSKVVAEYHFSTPTRDFFFNPSYYMLFDKGFGDADQNQSVWMLSEQERDINFKDILSVRLTQLDKGSGVSNNNAYTTHVTSEWSTDLADTECHKETKLPVAKAGNAIKATTEKSGGTVTMYVILQDPEFTSNPAETANTNSKIMKDYVSQANNILGQFQKAANSNGAAMTAKSSKDLSVAMYSNVTNLSSLNSGYRVTETNGLPLLNDKEPLKFNSDVKLTYEITTGEGDTAGLANWEFYALPGYKVKDSENKDISDTTSEDKRTITLNYTTRNVHNIDSAKPYQEKVISELNDRLCMLMVPQDKSRSESLACPSGTTPYLAGAGNFDWYAEDYEGFVVGVYEIKFTMQGNAKSEAHGTNTAIETKFSTIYRSESDWQAAFNELAAKPGHDLTVYTPATFSGFNISNFMDSNCSSNVSRQMQLGNNGTFQLITKDGASKLDQWAKKTYNKKNFADGIYGMGLELANLNISFGSSTASNGRKVQVVGGSGTGKPFSFYYQPTYFNIRGSVYDTAR